GTARAPSSRRAPRARRSRSWAWKAIELARVAGEDPGAQLLRQRRRQGLSRRVEVPVWVVGREQQAVCEIALLEHPDEVLRVVRLLDRLCREPDALADQLRWLAVERRHVVPQELPRAVERPAERDR